MSRARALGLAWALAWAAGCGNGAEPTAEPSFDPCADDRVRNLFLGCAKSDFYDRNLSDLTPILVEKLALGERDPLNRSKEELRNLGSAALPELRRFVERHYSEAMGVSLLKNAVDVLIGTDAPEARELLLRCLAHPSDTVRLGAIQGLQLGHATPADFELLVHQLDLEINERRNQVAVAIHSADPARAEGLYLDWMEAGEQSDLYPYVAPLVAPSTLAATAERCASAFPQVPVTVRAHVAAPAAAAGHGVALEFLEAELSLDGSEGNHSHRRNLAVDAAMRAGLRPLLIETLTRDPDPRLRALAASGLGPQDDGELDDEARAALRFGLDDVTPDVRRACLGILAAAGDATAIDRALSQLTGGPASLQEGMGALIGPMNADPELAARTYARLLERDELEAFLPPAKRITTLKVIGQVPLAEAALFLRRVALEHPEAEVAGLPVHRWTMIQAANTGDVGRAALMGELGSESDPRRRLDLLWAISASRSDATRDGLLELAESGTLGPCELLFVCDALAKLGPAARMAPRLKRVANRVGEEEGEVRRALQCLLWRWY